MITHQPVNAGATRFNYKAEAEAEMLDITLGLDDHSVPLEVTIAPDGKQLWINTFRCLVRIYNLKGVIIEDHREQDTREIPNFGNATPNSLLDEIGELGEVERAAKAKRAVTREAFNARLTDEDKKRGAFRGEKFTATLKWVPQETLDIEAIRRDMTDEWIKKYTKEGGYHRLLTKRIPKPIV